jgi:hypothetical protein
MVVGVVVVGLHEADRDEVADAVVITPLLAIDRLVAEMDRHYGSVPAPEENDEGDVAPAAEPAVPNPRGGNAGNQFGCNTHGYGHAGR